MNDQRKTPEELLDAAMQAVEQLDVWANCNETEYTGYGDQVVPPMATFWRVKAGQAFQALQEIRFDAKR